LQAAFEELARRLQAAPVARLRKPVRLVLPQLGVDALSTDELLGPRGVERLADVFFSQLVQKGGLS
jgi:hypothetical protein